MKRKILFSILLILATTIVQAQYLFKSIKVVDPVGFTMVPSVEPVVGEAGSFYVSTANILYVSNGITWVPVGVDEIPGLQAVTEVGNTTNTNVNLTNGVNITGVVNIDSDDSYHSLILNDGYGNQVLRGIRSGAFWTGYTGYTTSFQTGETNDAIIFSTNTNEPSPYTLMNTSAFKVSPEGANVTVPTGIFELNNGTAKVFNVETDGVTTIANSIEATSVIKTGGTSSQFLKADGSVDASVYVTDNTLQAVTEAGGTTDQDVTFTGGINLSNNTVKIGVSGGTSSKVIQVAGLGTQAGIRYQETLNRWEFANDGFTWNPIGSASGDFVDLTSDQTIAGNKTFAETMAVEYEQSTVSPMFRIRNTYPTPGRSTIMDFEAINGSGNYVRTARIDADMSTSAEGSEAGILRVSVPDGAGSYSAWIFDSNGAFFSDAFTLSGGSTGQIITSGQFGDFIWTDPIFTLPVTINDQLNISDVALEESTSIPGALSIANNIGTDTGIEFYVSSTAEWGLVGDENSFSLLDNFNGTVAWKHDKAGGVIQYYDDTEKIRTTVDGVTVTGDVVASDIVYGDAFRANSDNVNYSSFIRDGVGSVLYVKQIDDTETDIASFRGGGTGTAMVDGTEYLKVSTSGIDVTGNVVATNVWPVFYQTLTGTTPSHNATTTVNTKITLTGNTTLTLTNLVNGMSGNIKVYQDATGGHTITISPTPGVINGGGGVITLTGTALSKDILSWTYDGTELDFTYGLNYN